MTYNERLNECLAAIKNGDKTKFSDLFELTYGPLMYVAKRYLYNKSDAQLVVADVYDKIYRYADRYNTSKDAKAYLWQIVKNKAYDYNKKCLKNNTVNIDDLAIFDHIDQFERANLRMDLIKALKKVGYPDALIVIWTYRERMTQEEIGLRLNMTKSAVCQRLNKAKKKLSEYLDKC